MLYTLINDSDQYLDFYFDEDQILRIIGELDETTVDRRIDLNSIARSYEGIINEPLVFSFPTEKKKKIPDLQVHNGRLFLSAKAYIILKPIIDADGEFLPVRYEAGDGYFFVPLRVAEVDSLVTKKDTWGEVVNLGFVEGDVKGWSMFRTDYNNCMYLYCDDVVKGTIEKAGLSGLYITNDLANIFPEPRTAVTSQDA